MSDKTQKPETEASEQKTKKRRRKKWPIVLLVLLALAVILAICTMLFPRVFDLDKLGRYFNYLGMSTKASYGEVVYDANTTNDYGSFAGGLLVGSESGLTLFNLEGGQEAVVQGSLPSPTIKRCDELAVCYSPGSSYIAAVGKNGKTLLDETVSGLLLDADLSSDGYLCYTTSESGVKTVATVLNRNQDAFFKLSSRTQYLNVCAVSPGGGYLAVAGLGEDNSTYNTTLTILRTDEAISDLEGDESSAVRVQLGNRVVYDMTFLSSTHLCVLTQDNLIFLDTDGYRLNELDLTATPLADYAVGDGFIALALRQRQAGDKAEVVTLDADGIELGRQTVEDRVRSISAAGSYVDVLTDRSLEIYNKKLLRFEQLRDVPAATLVLARDDGTALLVSSSQARLVIP